MEDISRQAATDAKELLSLLFFNCSINLSHQRGIWKTASAHEGNAAQEAVAGGEVLAVADMP